MRRFGIVLSYLVLVPLAGDRAAAVEATAAELVSDDRIEAPDLSLVLDRLARVARLYEEGALDFTCDEVVHFRRRGEPRRRVRYRYIYRHRDDRLEDYRISTALGSRKDRDGRIDYPGPALLLRPYTWIFCFGARQQTMNDYRLLGTAEVLGRPAVGVWIEPTDPAYVVEGVNDWIGAFWIDVETFQLLHVDAYLAQEYRVRKELEHRLEVAETDEYGRIERSRHSVERVKTYFEIVEHGLRFPSRTVIERRDYLVPFDESLEDGQVRYRVDQRYSNYRFYATKTRESLHAFSVPSP